MKPNSPDATRYALTASQREQSTSRASRVHLPGLGGLRHARADSPNTAWRNASFRGFADYMQTAEFAQNIESLIELTKQEHVALMCAEAVPWRCHRSLIARMPSWCAALR